MRRPHGSMQKPGEAWSEGQQPNPSQLRAIVPKCGLCKMFVGKDGMETEEDL